MREKSAGKVSGSMRVGSLEFAEVFADGVALLRVAEGGAESLLVAELVTGLSLRVVGVVVGSHQSSCVDDACERTAAIHHGQLLSGGRGTARRWPPSATLEVGSCCWRVTML